MYMLALPKIFSEKNLEKSLTLAGVGLGWGGMDRPVTLHL